MLANRPKLQCLSKDCPSLSAVEQGGKGRLVMLQVTMQYTALYCEQEYVVTKYSESR
jgi:hypothetical protein